MLSSLNAYLGILGMVFALVIILSVAIPIFLHIFDKLTGEIDIWREIKKKNVAVAIVIAAAIIGISLIIGLIL